MRNHGLKVLGLAVLAVMGVMAFTAIGAQAQTFLYNLATPAGQAVTGEQLGTGFLLVAARDLKIECTGMDINEGVLNSSTDGKAKIFFLGCVANNHQGTPIPNCEFKQLGGITVEVLVLPVVHGGERYILFEGSPVIGTISFKSGIGCVLPLNNPVQGAVVAKVTTALDATVQTIVFSEINQLLVGDVLKYGALSNTSYLNGTADLKGVAAGSKLGIH